MHFALLLVLAATSAPQSWRFETDGSPTVSISNIKGSIRVEASDGKTVSVEASQEGSEADRAKSLIEVRQDGDEVSVHLCCGPCSSKHSSCNDPAPTHFVVKVPRDSELDVSSVEASVKVSGVGGDQELSSVSGAVEVKGSRGKLEVSSVSGRVELAPEALEDTDVNTVSGDVKLKLPPKASAAVDFSSVGGSFNGRGVSLGSVEQRYGAGAHDVDVSTVSGSLDIQSDEAAK